MKTIHGIFANSKTMGKHYISKLMENDKVISETGSDYGYTAICESGNVYKLLRFTDHQVGLRINYAHIDNVCLDMKYAEEILQNSIKPCITPHIRVDDKIVFW